MAATVAITRVIGTARHTMPAQGLLPLHALTLRLDDVLDPLINVVERLPRDMQHFKPLVPFMRQRGDHLLGNFLYFVFCSAVVDNNGRVGIFAVTNFWNGATRSFVPT